MEISCFTGAAAFLTGSNARLKVRSAYLAYHFVRALTLIFHFVSSDEESEQKEEEGGERGFGWMIGISIFLKGQVCCLEGRGRCRRWNTSSTKTRIIFPVDSSWRKHASFPKARRLNGKHSVCVRDPCFTLSNSSSLFYVASAINPSSPYKLKKID